MSDDTHHEFLPPSSAANWRHSACTMWPTMNATFPEKEPQLPAVEGQAVHWALATEILTEQQAQIGDRTPQGVVLDQEMTEAIETFMLAINPVIDQELHVEEKIKNDAIHPTLNGGTPDLWTFNAPYLDIYDFKFGHEFVDVFEWWQGINYAALILRQMGIGGAHDHMITVRFHVVQPRAYHRDGPHRTWEVRADHLRGHFNILRIGANEATGTAPQARPGPQCDYCPGRHACTILQRTTQAATDRTGQVLPMELPPEAVGIELRSLLKAKRMMEARITGLEAQALGLIKQGLRVPHFMVESNPGREKWTKPIAEVIALGAAMGVDLAKPADVITPNQARDKGIVPELVQAYSSRPHSAVKLVIDDGSKARKVFG